jgi:battenin
VAGAVAGVVRGSSNSSPRDYYPYLPPPPLLSSSAPLPDDPLPSSSSSSSSWKDRARAVLALYPYTVPLFAVYCAEYLMQSGVWPSIGVPDPQDASHRRAFYLAAGTAYQSGVFVSRSSGLLPLPRPGRRGLAVMAAAQVGLLCFFVAEAALGGGGTGGGGGGQGGDASPPPLHSDHPHPIADLLYGWLLLLGGCLLAGLLGGGVYVGAFSLIAAETPASGRAFALGAASVADASGIALADAAGILVQGCLFRAHSIAGAAFSCGGGGGAG